jgi:hypothetical protein
MSQIAGHDDAVVAVIQERIDCAVNQTLIVEWRRETSVEIGVSAAWAMALRTIGIDVRADARF